MSKLDSQELQEILKGVANKEKEKFNQLYTEYKGIVYGIAFSMLKNKENAEEVAQIVMAKIWDMKPENLPTSHATTWLYTLTKNETINWLRKQKDTVSLEDIYYIGEEDANLERLMEKEAYNKIVARLEPQDQEIVSLKVLSELSFREIAAVLDMPIGTVQWKYYKALHTLKMLFGNLSMFLVTIVAYVLQRKMRPKKEAEIEEQAPSENGTEAEKVIENDAISRGETNQLQGTPTKEELEIQNKVIQNTIQVVEEPQNNLPLENGLLGLSGIFLVATILFLGIFAKHQQNKKKNASK